MSAFTGLTEGTWFPHMTIYSNGDFHAGPAKRLA